MDPVCISSGRRLSRLKRPFGASYAFEDPDRSALSAAVFWRSDVSAFVLPLRAAAEASGDRRAMLDLAALRCYVTMLITPDHAQHVLIADGSRRLQLLVRGRSVLHSVPLMTDAIVDPCSVAYRLMLFRRLSDLVACATLRPTLYASDVPWRRLSFVLQALDGRLAAAGYRNIAIALFGPHRVASEWRNPGNHLLDRVRRAVRRGRVLMQHGYLDFLKP